MSMKKALLASICISSTLPISGTVVYASSPNIERPNLNKMEMFPTDPKERKSIVCTISDYVQTKGRKTRERIENTINIINTTQIPCDELNDLFNIYDLLLKCLKGSFNLIEQNICDDSIGSNFKKLKRFMLRFGDECDNCCKALDEKKTESNILEVWMCLRQHIERIKESLIILTEMENMKENYESVSNTLSRVKYEINKNEEDMSLFALMYDLKITDEL